jgi:hypothetical protein
MKYPTIMGAKDSRIKRRKGEKKSQRFTSEQTSSILKKDTPWIKRGSGVCKELGRNYLLTTAIADSNQSRADFAQAALSILAA